MAVRVLSERMAAKIIIEDSGLATDRAEMEKIILVSNDHALDMSHDLSFFLGGEINVVCHSAWYH